MKLLIFLLLIVGSPVVYCQDSTAVKKCNLKTYYYYWSGDYYSTAFPGRYAWGEYSICLDHKPNKTEVMGFIKKYAIGYKPDPYYKTIKIHMIEEIDRPCLACINADSVKILFGKKYQN